MRERGPARPALYSIGAGADSPGRSETAPSGRCAPSRRPTMRLQAGLPAGRPAAPISKPWSEWPGTDAHAGEAGARSPPAGDLSAPILIRSRTR